MWVADEVDDASLDYVPTNTEELGWLGYFIGNSTNLKELIWQRNIINDIGIEYFCHGLSRNTSIWKIQFSNIDLLGGKIFQMMDPFFKNNHKLNEVHVDACEIGAGCARLLSLTPGGCNNKLKHISLKNSQIGDGQLVDIIVALSTHPRLETLQLMGMGIGVNECTALATLLRWTTTDLHTLNLNGNNIDDEGFEVLAHALAKCNKLRKLDFYNNQTMAFRGCHALSTLLENPNSTLEVLRLYGNDIGDEGVLIFANALKGNCKLKTLSLFGGTSTEEGWSTLSELLCDTSSVNKTFLSNHTLKQMRRSLIAPQDVRYFLALNGSNKDKKQIAMEKILHQHSHFNTQPFFEWEFKVLPLIIDWFARASFCTTGFHEKIRTMKLSALYDYVRWMPMLYVKARTMQELEEIGAMEMKLRWEQMVLSMKLEEIQQHKARATMRL